MEYEVTSPEGRKFIVEGPAGASQEEVLAQVQEYSQQAPQAAPQAPQEEEESWLEYGVGLADQAIDGVMMGYSDEVASGLNALTNWDNGPTIADRYSRNLEAARGRREAFKSENPYASTAAEVVGAVGSGVGAAARLPAYAIPKIGQFANSALRAAGIGGVESAVYGSGTALPGERLQGAIDAVPMGVAMGPVGAGLGEVGQRILRNMPGLNRYMKQFTPEGAMAQSNFQTAKDFNLKMTAGDVNPLLKPLEAGLSRNPIGGIPFAMKRNHNQKVIQQAANKRLGVPDGETNLGLAKKQNAEAFERVADSGIQIDMDADFKKAINTVESSYKQGLGQNPPKKFFADLYEEIDAGKMDARRYMDIQTQLSDLLHKASKKGDGAKVRMYSGIKNALDDAADRSDLRFNDDFQEARKVFQSRVVMERPGVTNPGSGDISVPKMANAQKRNQGFTMGTDQSDLARLGRYQQAFKETVPNSGTATAEPLAMLTAPILGPIGFGYNAIMRPGVMGSTGGGRAGAGLAPALIALPDGLEKYRKDDKNKR